MNIGENIKRIRKEKGMTQKELGGRLGISQAAVGQFENNCSNLKIDTIKKIADALEVSHTRLILETPFTSGSKEERSKMSDEELADYLTYITTDNESQKQQILERRNRSISNNRYTISVDIDTEHPFNILQEKIKRGESLTPEESALFREYMQKGFVSLKKSMNKLGKVIEANYKLLNEEGQKKADEQIDRAIEQIELLTKIPEYQKEQVALLSGIEAVKKKMELPDDDCIIEIEAKINDTKEE
ncbi:MAG: helix-turn-helix domain-containing protein [Lachnospiraceae bacterium]|nr:helix-turn-helix domain-containing protein [Lachnospiraceae bacterium]